MNHQQVLRFTWRSLAMAAIVAILAAAPAGADEGRHDLRLEEILVGDHEATLRGDCLNWLSARFSAHGADDHDVASGAIKIRFSWADGAVSPAGAEWTALTNEVTVTFAEEEELYFTKVWPDDFTPEPSRTRYIEPTGSHPGAPAIVFRPSSAYPVIHLKAEIYYSDGQDSQEDDNTMIRPNVSVTAGESCGLWPDFCMQAGDFWVCPVLFPSDGPLYALLTDRWDNPGKYEKDPWLKLKAPLCKLVNCPPCLSCGEDVFVLHFSQPEDLHITLFGNNQPVATAQRLPRPVTIGKETFHYRLTFQSKRGVTYRLGVAPGATTPTNVPLSLGVNLSRGDK